MPTTMYFGLSDGVDHGSPTRLMVHGAPTHRGLPVPMPGANHNAFTFFFYFFFCSPSTGRGAPRARPPNKTAWQKKKKLKSVSDLACHFATVLWCVGPRWPATPRDAILPGTSARHPVCGTMRYVPCFAIRARPNRLRPCPLTRAIWYATVGRSARDRVFFFRCQSDSIRVHARRTRPLTKKKNNGAGCSMAMWGA